jgi:hypothetical protein
LPDSHHKFESKLKIVIPDIVLEDHDLLGDCYQYPSSKYELLKKVSSYTSEKIFDSKVKDLKISEDTSNFDSGCVDGKIILNSKVKNLLQVYDLD